MRVTRYGPDSFEEHERDGEAALPRGDVPVTWIDIEGVPDPELLRGLGETFGLHPLALEDVQNSHQRAKVEDFGDHLFVVARLAPLVVAGPPGPAETARIGETTQVGIFVGDDFVVTATEHEDDTFAAVRERIRRGSGRIRASGPDYLAYAVLDLAIDSFFPHLESAGDRLEVLEDHILEDPSAVPIGEIQRLRRGLIAIRRSVWPLREVVNVLLRDDSALVTDRTRVYLRDCHDHAIQVIDLVESYRDVTSGLTDLFMSSVSSRMNEVMKVLTIIGTIFIPLGFIAGLYGMNFDTTASPWNMPETRWYWGYPLALALMTGVAGVMLAYFVRRGWIRVFRASAADRDRERTVEST